jgi:DegV family protein with EDD domain
MLPINIHFGENHYLDKITITPKQFYTLLDEIQAFPSTSQVNDTAFLNLYSQLASHYDSIIAVHLTGKFSGTLNSSRKAAEKVSKEFNKQISVIDSRNLSGGLGLLTLRIARAIESGWTHSEILEASDQWLRKTKIFVSVRTLAYMVRGGRVSQVKGQLARLLNINPIVSMDEEGKSILFGKTFNQQSNMKKIMEHIRDLSNGKDIWNYIILHADNEDAAKWYTDQMNALTGKIPVDTLNISPVIGMNAGVGAAAVSFMFE